MRNLERNKIEITYYLYTGETERVDENGYYTGEKTPTYADAQTIRASVSASRGTSDVDQFGINVPYSNTVIVDDMDCPIAEDSRLEINGEPYAVVLVAKSFNHITYAVQRLTKPTALPEANISDHENQD